MHLREYQQRCLALSLEHYQSGINRQLAVLATGLGKTAIAANLRAHHGLGKKVLFLVHMETLAVQAATAMQKWNPDLRVGVEMAGSYVNMDGLYPPHFIVASVPTLGRKGSDRIKRFDPFEFDAVIQDEAHIGVSDSFKRVYDHFGLLTPNPDGPLFLGITATPNRTDGKGLKELFDCIVFDMGIQKGIAEGWLCDLVGFRVNGKAHLDKVHTRAGDFAIDELEDAVNTPERNAIIVKEWAKRAWDKRTLAFTVDVQHALDLAAAFTAHGIAAGAVWGEDPDRHQKIRQHKCGELTVLTNCNVLGIGYDDPKIECIDDKTEVLTPHGWRGIDDDFDSVVTVRPETLTLETCGVDARVERESNEIVCAESPRFNFRVTPNHRMFVGTGRIENHPHWEMAGDLPRMERFRLPLAGKYNSHRRIDLTDDELRLIAWFITDGCWNRKPTTISIAQSKPHEKIRIRKLLERLNLRFTEHVSSNKNGFGKESALPLTRFLIPKGIKGKLAKGRGWERLGFYLDKTAKSLMGMSRDQFDVFWEELLHGDGAGEHRANRLNQLIVCDDLLLSNLQAMAAQCGYSTNATSRQLDSGVTVWMMSVSSRPHIEVRPVRKGSKPTVWQDSCAFPVRVWCAQNKNGTLIIRRNGSVCVVGNCIISAAPTKSELRYVQQVGRGTRICEGKTECMVIDVVDNCKKHSLTTISTLLGLPKDLDLKGEKYSVAKERLDRMAAEFPTANVQDIKSLDQLKSIAENVSLFQVDYPPELSRLSELAWRRSPDGYVLAVNRDLISITKDLREEYQIRGKIGDRVAELSAQNLPGALNLADKFILDNGGVKPILARDSRWHGDKPTDKQLSLARILKIQVPLNCTKGQLSHAIDAKRMQMRRP